MSGFRSLVLLPAVLLSLAALSPSRAADLYVSAKGSDTNNGVTDKAPLLTLQKADSLVKPGDTVWIMDGVYRNTKTDKGGGSSSLLTVTHSGTPDAWITWKAYPNAHPELIAQGCWQAIDLKASYVAFDGLTLTGNNDRVSLADAERNGEVNVGATYAAWEAEGSRARSGDFSATPDKGKPGAAPTPKAAPKPKSMPVTYESPSPLYNGSGISVDCRGNKPLYHHFRLSNLTVRKFGTCGIAMMGTDYYTIENCEVYDNCWYNRYGGSGISQLGGRAFDTNPGYHNVIRGNRVWNNKNLVRVYYLGLGLISDGNGIILDSLVNYPGDCLIENNLSQGNGGAGIHVFKSSKAHIDIVNNTVWGNQLDWQLYDMGALAATNVRFFNNIVMADKYRQVNGKDEPGIVYDYNLYGSSQIGTKGPHDIVGDPLFVLPSTNRRDSDFHLRPGSPALASGTTLLVPKSDLLGKPRPADTAPDRGAFERTK